MGVTCFGNRCLRWILLCVCVAVCADGPAIAEGIPQVQWKFRCRSPIYASPVAVDLVGSPGLEILVVSSSERKLLCLSTAREVLWSYDDFTLRVTSTPTVADLNGDGRREILITTRSDGVVCLHADGTLWWKSAADDHVPWGNASVVDADHDGRAEIYWISTSGVLECHAPDGAMRWQVALPGGGTDGPLAVGDVDGDGQAEIIACGGRSVTCFDPSGKEQWHFEGMSAFHAGPVIADVIGTADPEVFVASHDGVFYCLDGRTGSVIWNHRTFKGRIDTTIAVGDIDGDGSREVLYGDGAGHLYCLNHRGEERWSFSTGDWIEGAPVLGDVNGDGQVDVLVGSANGKVDCLSRTGALQWTFATGKRVSASPTLCDHDQNGKVDILVASHNGTLYSLTAFGRWDPKRMLWPIRRGDLAQTAHLPAR